MIGLCFRTLVATLFCLMYCLLPRGLVVTFIGRLCEFCIASFPEDFLQIFCCIHELTPLYQSLLLMPTSWSYFVYWCRRYVQTLWVDTDVIVGICGAMTTLWLDLVVLPTLQLDLYYIATCVVDVMVRLLLYCDLCCRSYSRTSLDQSIFDWYSQCRVITTAHYRFIVFRNSPLPRNRDRTSIE